VDSDMSISEQDYQLLSQYLDHELPLPANRELEQRLASEPQLQAALQQLQATDNQLKSIFAAAQLKNVPARIVAMLDKAPSNVVSLPQRRVANWGFALAASLVVATSAVLLSQYGQGPAGIAGTDQLLAASLEQSSSRGEGWDNMEDGRQFRSVLSFQSNDGHWCREYLLSAGQTGWHGVACRKEGHWVQEVQVAASMTDASSHYRPASASDSGQIADFIDRSSADIALDRNQEAALIARQWQ